MKNGPATLADEELMAVVLGSGSREQDVFSLSRQVVSLLRESKTSPSLAELRSIPGIGQVRAAQIQAILEFSRRFLLGASATPVRSTAEAVPYFAPLKASEQEEFAVLTLDGAGRPIRIHRVTKGLVDRSFVHPREAFLPAVRDNAVSIIVAHNHPSGNLEPSDADLEATRRLMQASRTLGIPMLDHLIVSRAGYVSLREQAPEAFRN